MSQKKVSAQRLTERKVAEVGLVGGVVTEDEVRVANSREARIGAGTPVQEKK